MHKFKYIFFLECILSTWQTLKAKNTHLRTARVVQDCHNSLISAFLISQLDLLLTTAVDTIAVASNLEWEWPDWHFC